MSIKKIIILISLLGTILLAPAMLTSFSNKAYADMCTQVVKYSCQLGTKWIPFPVGKGVEGGCRLALDPFCIPVIDPDPRCPDMSSCDPNQDPNCPQNTSCDSEPAQGPCSLFSNNPCGNSNQPQQDPNCPLKACGNSNQPQQDPNCPANTSCDPNQPQQDPNCPANTSCDPNQPQQESTNGDGNNGAGDSGGRDSGGGTDSSCLEFCTPTSIPPG